MIRALAILAFMSVFPVQAEAPAPGHVVSEERFAEVAVPFVRKWEGSVLTTYLDRIASPPIYTVCSGHTGPYAIPGKTYSQAFCDDLLGDELLEYREGLHRYLTADTLRTRLPVTRDTAYTSLAFNVGIAGAGGSTAVRRLNAGDVAGGCEALTWWSKAGGRVVRGLVRRRAEEKALCLQ